MDAEPMPEDHNSNINNPEIVSGGTYIPAHETYKPSQSHKSHKAPKIILSVIVVLAVAAIVGGIFIFQNRNADKNSQTAVTVNDLSEEQKKKLGINPENETKTNSSEIENENNYSEEYKKYLELPEEEKEKLEVVPRKEDVPEEKIEEIKEEAEEEVVAGLPSKFDLRDKISMEVEYQGGYGLCWAYATSKALETNLKLRGVDYNPSELQIDFLTSDLMYSNWRKLHNGGNFSDYIDIASSIGTMSEADYEKLAIDPDAEYDADNQNNSYFQLANNASPVYVTKTVDFPSIYKENGVASEKTDEELKEFRDLVKAHIIKNGALYAVVNAPRDSVISIGRDENTKYEYAPNADSYDDSRGYHAMAIVGWDDNFSKDRFVGTGSGEGIEKPLHDGAYLVLNSWGAAWGDNGYYWISYDEYNVEAYLSGIVSTSLEDTKKVNDISSAPARELIKEKLSFYIINNGGEELISDYALSKVSYLDFSSRNLNDNDLVNIVSTFPNLTSLDISDNNISDLQPLTKLSNLYDVSVQKNNIKDISVICNLENLSGYGFDLSYNNISDVSCLANKMEGDSYLNLSGNVGVTGYEKITKLVSLNLDGVGLESLESLSDLKNLYFLSVANNNIKSLAGFSTDQELMNEINLSGNKGITDLSFDKPVSYLYVGDSGLTDISILNNIKANTIIAGGNSFKDLSGFNNSETIELHLSGNKGLSNFSALKDVKIVYLEDCGLTSFSELSGLQGVEYLNLNNNEIGSFDGIGELSNLQDLTIENNRLSSMDGIAKAEKLASVTADNNTISNADELTQLSNLYFISLNNNQISSIPAFYNHSDIHLALANNPLENIAIPFGIASINLENCNIKTIDYSAAGRLSYAGLEGNPDWNDYVGLISHIAPQHGGAEDPLYIGVQTDHTFTKEEMSAIADIKDSYGEAVSISVVLSTVHSELKKTADGVVYLNNYPSIRHMFMDRLVLGKSIKGFSVDKAASKIVLPSSSTESIILDDYWVDLDGRGNVYALGYTFDLSF